MACDNNIIIASISNSIIASNSIIIAGSSNTGSSNSTYRVSDILTMAISINREK